MRAASLTRRLLVALVAAILVLPAATASADPVKVVTQGLNAPRGIDADDGRLLVATPTRAPSARSERARTGREDALATIPNAADVLRQDGSFSSP